MEPTHPDRLVENVTAPSEGGFPGPDGEVRLSMRLPFRIPSSDEQAGAVGHHRPGSTWRASWLRRKHAKCGARPITPQCAPRACGMVTKSLRSEGRSMLFSVFAA